MKTGFTCKIVNSEARRIKGAWPSISFAAVFYSVYDVSKFMLENIRIEKILSEYSFFDDQKSTFIFQDSQEFIWFGTSRALARYDGQNLKIYEHDKFNPNGIPKGWVREMYENGSGNFNFKKK